MELIPKALVVGVFAPPPPSPTPIVTQEKINQVWAELAPRHGYRQLQFGPDGSAAQFLGATGDDGATIQLPLLQVRSRIATTAMNAADEAQHAQSYGESTWAEPVLQPRYQAHLPLANCRQRWARVRPAPRDGQGPRGSRRHQPRRRAFWVVSNSVRVRQTDPTTRSSANPGSQTQDLCCWRSTRSSPDRSVWIPSKTRHAKQSSTALDPLRATLRVRREPLDQATPTPAEGKVTKMNTATDDQPVGFDQFSDYGRSTTRVLAGAFVSRRFGLATAAPPSESEAETVAIEANGVLYATLVRRLAEPGDVVDATTIYPDLFVLVAPRAGHGDRRHTAGDDRGGRASSGCRGLPQGRI